MSKRKERKESRTNRHGNVFSRKSGSMYIHMQRENGLAHQTMVLRPWQVQLLRAVVSPWTVVVIATMGLGWGYFAVQAARIPVLNQRIAHLQEDARRLDTLQQALTQLQTRYEQVQRMLSTSGTASTKHDGAAATDHATAPEQTKKK